MGTHGLKKNNKPAGGGFFVSKNTRTVRISSLSSNNFTYSAYRFFDLLSVRGNCGTVTSNHSKFPASLSGAFHMVQASEHLCNYIRVKALKVARIIKRVIFTLGAFP